MSLLANLALQDQTDPSAENDQTGGDRSDASIARGKHRHPLPAVVSPPASNSPGNRNDSPAPVPKRRATVSVLSKALGATPEVASKLMAKAAAMKSGSFSRNRRRIMDDEDADPDDDADPPADQENHNSADENVPSPRPAAPAGRGGNRLGADFFRVSGTAPAPSSGSSSARRNGSARAAPAPDFEFDEFTGEVTEVDKDADGQTGDAEEEKNRRQREIEKKQEQTRNVQRRKLELQREAQERLTAAAAAATSGRPAKPVRDIAADPDVPVDVPDDGDDANAVISDEPEEPEYVPYRHPRHDLIETRLGPACPEDSFCYIRDVVKQMDPGSRPKEVEDLLAAVHADNYDTQDKVDVAMHIKALFDETIRAKANRKRRPDGEDVVKEWTLRSVYNYLTKQENSSQAILEDVKVRLHTALATIDDGMYRAPKDKKRRRTVTAQDLRIEKGDLQNMLAVTGKLLTVVGMREKLKVDGGSGSIGSARGIGGKKAGAGDRGGRAISTLMGATSTKKPGTKESDIQRKKEQMFS